MLLIPFFSLLEAGKIQTVKGERDKKHRKGRDLQVLVDLNNMCSVTRLPPRSRVSMGWASECGQHESCQVKIPERIISHVIHCIYKQLAFGT